MSDEELNEEMENIRALLNAGPPYDKAKVAFYFGVLMGAIYKLRQDRDAK